MNNDTSSSNYAQQMWQAREHEQHRGKGAHVFGWIFGVTVGLAAIAAITQAYWYPYVAPYLHI